MGEHNLIMTEDQSVVKSVEKASQSFAMTRGSIQRAPRIITCGPEHSTLDERNWKQVNRSFKASLKHKTAYKEYLKNLKSPKVRRETAVVKSLPPVAKSSKNQSKINVDISKKVIEEAAVQTGEEFKVLDKSLANTMVQPTPQKPDNPGDVTLV